MCSYGALCTVHLGYFSVHMYFVCLIFWTFGEFHLSHPIFCQSHDYRVEATAIQRSDKKVVCFKTLHLTILASLESYKGNQLE